MKKVNLLKTLKKFHQQNRSFNTQKNSKSILTMFQTFFSLSQHKNSFSSLNIARSKKAKSKTCVEGGEDEDIKGLQYFDTHFYGGVAEKVE
jgi:hypothetical protein